MRRFAPICSTHVSMWDGELASLAGHATHVTSDVMSPSGKNPGFFPESNAAPTIWSARERPQTLQEKARCVGKVLIWELSDSRARRKPVSGSLWEHGSHGFSHHPKEKDVHVWSKHGHDEGWTTLARVK